MRSVDTHKVRVVLKESLPFVMVTEQFSKTVADEAKCMEVIYSLLYSLHPIFIFQITLPFLHPSRKQNKKLRSSLFFFLCSFIGNNLDSLDRDWS